MLKRLNLMKRLLLLLALALMAGACLPQSDGGESPARHPIVYGLTIEPSGFDPHIHQSATMGIVLRQVYDTLVYRDAATGDFTAGLATSWSVSPDGLTYTFTLRQGVTFHDGTPFNAQAVGANLDRITGGTITSQRALASLGPYVGYDVVDAYTLRVRLSAPYAPLLDSFAQVYLSIASPTALAAYSPERYQYHQVGTGPFTFVDYVPGSHITVRRNPDYAWGPAFYSALADNSVDEITFRFFSDPPTRVAALESGEADIIGELLPVDARALTANSQVRLIPISIPGQPIQFLFNTRKYPTDNPIVRQALIFGTNRNAIVDTVYQGFSAAAWGPLSSNTLFFSRELLGAYAQDTGQAQSLLTSVGLADSDGNGYLDAPGGGDLEIIIVVWGFNFAPEIAQLIQDQWRSIGVRVVLDAMPGFTALRERVQRGDYHLVSYYSAGYDAWLLNQTFMSGSAMNWTGYADAQLDALLTQAAQQIDPAARAAPYAQAQRLVMEQALILPISDFVVLNGSRASINGLQFDPYGWYPLLSNVTVTAG